MRPLSIITRLCLVVTVATAQTTPGKQLDPKVTELWDIKASKITPAAYPVEVPSDAVLLVNGKDRSECTKLDGSEAKWEVKDGAFTVVKGSGVIKTKQTFSDFQLHIEWRTPPEVV